MFSKYHSIVQIKEYAVHTGVKGLSGSSKDEKRSFLFCPLTLGDIPASRLNSPFFTGPANMTTTELRPFLSFQLASRLLCSAQQADKGLSCAVFWLKCVVSPSILCDIRWWRFNLHTEPGLTPLPSTSYDLQQNLFYVPSALDKLRRKPFALHL